MCKQKMYLLTLGLILICCNVWAMKINGNVVDKYAGTPMEEFLNKLKTILRTGNDTLGIPVLDPFATDRIEINLKEDILNFEALLEKINVNGLSGYDIIRADHKIELIAMKVNVLIHLSWPLIVAKTNYTLKGKIDDFEIYGKGEMKMSPQDFAFDTEIEFKIEGGLSGHLKVDNMKLKLSLKALDFQVTGLYDDEEVSKILSAVVSDMASEFISDEKLMNKLKPLVTKQLDSILSQITVLELLKLLQSF